jgi:Subtilase family
MKAPGFIRVLSLLGCAALAACFGSPLTPSSPVSSVDGAYSPVGATVRAACPPVTTPHVMRCFARIRTNVRLLASPDGGIPAGVGFSPRDIASAYGLDQSRGGDQTIAIVDAYGYTQAADDLAYYRRAAGLPPCSVASKCLRIVNQNGDASPLPKPPSKDNIGWDFEQAEDLDAVSATCPKCKLILVEAEVANPTPLGIAAHTAATKLGAGIITNSYGEPESPDVTRDYDVPGHLFVAASLDNGGGTKNGGGPVTPCMYATVVCAGGTRLVRDKSARGWNETVYDDYILKCSPDCGATGSGCSTIIPKPSYQFDNGCKMRSGVDVSADASVFTPLAIYSVLFKKVYGTNTGWTWGAGTSLASPIIAGIFALAGNAATRHGAQELWENKTGFFDVVDGTNIYPSTTGVCASSIPYVCHARPGYDGPTGLGTPNGMTAF